MPPPSDSELIGENCVNARRGLVEWLRTQWGAAGRALYQMTTYFDSDDEVEVQGASLIAGPLGCGKTRVRQRGGGQQAGFSVLTMELDASAPANELQKRYKEATSSRRLRARASWF